MRVQTCTTVMYSQNLNLITESLNDKTTKKQRSFSGVPWKPVTNSPCVTGHSSCDHGNNTPPGHFNVTKWRKRLFFYPMKNRRKEGCEIPYIGIISRL